MPSTAASCLRRVAIGAFCVAGFSMVVFIVTARPRHRSENPHYGRRKELAHKGYPATESNDLSARSDGDQYEEQRMLHYRQELCSTLPSPEVLDFLLGCVRAAVDSGPHYLKWFVLPSTFPLEPSRVHEVTDSFPRLDSKSTISDIIGTGNLQSERYLLLKWLAATFRHRILPANSDLQVPEVPSITQFIQLSSEPLHQEDFLTWIATRCPEGGRAGFHGTPAINLLSILYGGLKAKGKGVFFASDPEVSMQRIYYGGICYDQNSIGIMKGWKNSAFKDVAVLLGVEVARKEAEWAPFDSYHSGKCRADEIAVRHVFVMPRDALLQGVKRYRGGSEGVSIYGGPRARATMEEVYRRIYRGDFDKPTLRDAYDLE
ncbi:hypothetical protein O1611_g8860 [Lasiodiplodia mahajangana]|uniref:Uncharacterized protein n=1 Tax=Lasiodiplodia mahajangana TaxID=1108764 RepID=A0ACC2JBE5_9PEZI|nr:hypothetical protein O1611_g8860 [Lasiodiplodia mahajangana]